MLQLKSNPSENEEKEAQSQLVKSDEMQHLRSQALDAFESSDFTAAITFLDKILEVSCFALAADKPDSYCIFLWGMFICFDMLYTTKILGSIKSDQLWGFPLLIERWRLYRTEVGPEIFSENTEGVMEWDLVFLYIACFAVFVCYCIFCGVGQENSRG